MLESLLHMEARFNSDIWPLSTPPLILALTFTEFTDCSISLKYDESLMTDHVTADRIYRPTLRGPTTLSDHFCS